MTRSLKLHRYIWKGIQSLLHKHLIVWDNFKIVSYHIVLRIFVFVTGNPIQESIIRQIV
jgi:hypothetical protein